MKNTIKTLVKTTLVTTALFTSSAYAIGLSDVNAQSTEINLATGVSSAATGFQVSVNPLSVLEKSVQGHLSANTTDFGNAATDRATDRITHTGLEAPASSSEALL